MIQVVNRKTYEPTGAPWEVYIGRPSPLGNPFKERDFRRARCIQLFEEELRAAILLPKHLRYDSLRLDRMRLEFERLGRLLEEYDKLVLICWCAPKSCHGDVIKRMLEENQRRKHISQYAGSVS